LTKTTIKGNTAGAGGFGASYCDADCMRNDDSGWGCDGGDGGSGGGIFNNGVLTVTKSTVTDNASGAGGCGAGGDSAGPVATLATAGIFNGTPSVSSTARSATMRPPGRL
jgi:hypothetical protein